jgi:putative PIN family toxin of toxin-antitoxin system
MKVGASVVLDTNVVLDWLVFEDPAVRDLVRDVESGALRVVTSDECVAELRRVLGYPVLQLGAGAQGAALARYMEHASTPPDALREPSGLPLCADPDDQKFLELAWHSNADLLVTKDKALLAMARKIARYERFSIIAPAAYAHPVAS